MPGQLNPLSPADLRRGGCFTAPNPGRCPARAGGRLHRLKRAPSGAAQQPERTCRARGQRRPPPTEGRPKPGSCGRRPLARAVNGRHLPRPAGRPSSPPPPPSQAAAAASSPPARRVRDARGSPAPQHPARTAAAASSSTAPPFKTPAPRNGRRGPAHRPPLPAARGRPRFAASVGFGHPRATPARRSRLRREERGRGRRASAPRCDGPASRKSWARSCR